MKLKDGRELSHLEIIKRLNLMGVGYNPDILGKNYYIELYNKAIKLPNNKEKIKKEIKKDQIYMDFYNKKLRKRNECSFQINNENNISYSIIKNRSETNCFEKKKFWGEFNGALMNKIIVSHFCFTTYDFAKNNSNKIKNIYYKCIVPINAIKKYSMINIYPDLKNGLKKVINIIDDLIIDKYSYILFFSFIIIILTIFHFIVKKYKNNKMNCFLNYLYNTNN